MSKKKKKKGFGHAILCAKTFVGNDPFFVLLGDHVYTTDHDQQKTCAQQLVDVYEKFGKSVTSMGLCDEGELSVNGIINGEMVLVGRIDGSAIMTCI